MSFTPEELLMNATLFLADALAIGLLVFGMFVPRHRRRDMVVAYLGVNIGVLAVSAALASSLTTLGAGVGLGLFGVLSIIRLRSEELNQREVAYYFSALTLGLLGGLGTTSVWLTVSLMAAVVLVMYVADHPRLLPRLRHQVMVLDRAETDEAVVVHRLERLLGATVHGVSVIKVDLVNDTMVVDVRFAAPDADALRTTGSSPVSPVGPLGAGGAR